MLFSVLFERYCKILYLSECCDVYLLLKYLIFDITILDMSVAILKSQDILLLCKLLVIEDRVMKQLDLSSSLGINQSEVSTGYDRLIRSHLLDSESKKPNKMQTFEFLESAVKFFFPAETLEYTVGIPTSIFGGDLSKEILVNQKGMARVWPFADGKMRGVGLKPIHESVPHAAMLDEKLYSILAAVDAMRLFPGGRVKEQASYIIRKAVFGSKNE